MLERVLQRLIYQLCFYRMRYHRLPYALPCVLPYFYGNLASFLLVIILNTLPEVLLNVVQYIYSKIIHICQFSNALPHFTISFFKKCQCTSFSKNVMVTPGNALKIMQICTYFTENV